MPASRIELPDDPRRRRAHLDGLNSALYKWDEKDTLAKRPALDPWQSDFDQGRRVGLDMARRNVDRKKALQQGVPGLVHRIKKALADKLARKHPELP